MSNDSIVWEGKFHFVSASVNSDGNSVLFGIRTYSHSHMCKDTVHGYVNPKRIWRQISIGQAGDKAIKLGQQYDREEQERLNRIENAQQNLDGVKEVLKIVGSL